MILEKVSASNLKGQHINVNLGPATAIIGPNASGKTAILEAIKFVCRGKFPEVKKGSWPELTAEGRFDLDRFVRRSINAKGTVSTESSFSDAELEALDLPLLNPEYYFGLTDRERTNYVFERVKLPGTYSGDAIISEIERLSFGEGHTEAIEKAKSEVVGEVRLIVKDAQLGLQQAMAIATENLRTRFTYWNRRCKETQGAVTTLTELKLRRENVAAAPADLDEQIKTAGKELAALNRQHGTKKQQLDEIDQKIATKQSVEKFLAADRIDYDASIARVRANQTKMGQEFERMADSIAGIDIEDTEKEWTGANRRNISAETEIKSLTERRNKLDQSLLDLEKRAECPYCHGKHTGWKDATRSVLKEELNELNSLMLYQTGIRDGSLSRLRDLSAVTKKFRETRAAMEPLQFELSRDKKVIEKLESEREQDKQKRANWKAELEKLHGSSLDASALEKEYAELHEAITAVEAKRDALNKIREDETRLNQDLLRARESAKEHTLADAQLSVTKKVAKLIDEKRNDMVLTAFETLLGTANKFVAGILKTPLTMSDGVIARMGDGVMIEHHWFSGTEKVLTYMAIAAALSASAPFKLVILDEFGRLDNGNQDAVVNRLLDLQKKQVIDQFIICGSNIGGHALGWAFLKVIEVK